MASPRQYIYYEGDQVEFIYFVKKSSCSYVLPKYTNQPYIHIVDGTCFGMVDIIARCLQRDDQSKKDATSRRDTLSGESVLEEDFSQLENWQNLTLKRSFSVRCSDKEPSELLTLSKGDLHKMKSLHSDNYDKIF